MMHELLFVTMIVFAAVVLVSQNAEAGGFCSQTADTLFNACRAGVTDDSLVKNANCINITNTAKRDDCLSELQSDKSDALQLCRDQHQWRLDACAVLGEQRYDPGFHGSKFDSDFRNLTKPNPYYPLNIGYKWKYKSLSKETNTVEVQNRTKSIHGVTCIVVLDQVFKGGFVTESTNDWFAQATNGTVWYCGEEVKEFETFKGDKPLKPELVNIEGSFKAGRDDAKPGIIFEVSPKTGDVYLEEFSLANAEDLSQILSVNYAFGSDADLDQMVPQQLADHFCGNHDCVVTKNISLLEPNVIERKYYARGIGVFLEVELTAKDISQLVDCNFDARCKNLPNP